MNLKLYQKLSIIFPKYTHLLKRQVQVTIMEIYNSIKLWICFQSNSQSQQKYSRVLPLVKKKRKIYKDSSISWKEASESSRNYMSFIHNRSMSSSKVFLTTLTPFLKRQSKTSCRDSSLILTHNCFQKLFQGSSYFRSTGDYLRHSRYNTDRKRMNQFSSVESEVISKLLLLIFSIRLDRRTRHFTVMSTHFWFRVR